MQRLAFVTGGVRGLGAAACRLLKAEGFQVAASCRKDSDASLRFQRENDIPVYKWDVCDFDACVKGVRQVESELGPIDVLVNNAGVTTDAIFHKMTLEQWSSVLLTDLSSMFNVTRQVINGMRERNFGRIINMASVKAQKGGIGQTNYCAAKAGVIGLTKALALENVRKGITVNAIAPGYCATEMVSAVPDDVLNKIVNSIPLGRLGKPEEVARCVAFLASDDAGLITGATLSANGAFYMH